MVKTTITTDFSDRSHILIRNTQFHSFPHINNKLFCIQHQTLELSIGIITECNKEVRI